MKAKTLQEEIAEIFNDAQRRYDAQDVYSGRGDRRFEELLTKEIRDACNKRLGEDGGPTISLEDVQLDQRMKKDKTSMQEKFERAFGLGAIAEELEELRAFLHANNAPVPDGSRPYQVMRSATRALEAYAQDMAWKAAKQQEEIDNTPPF